MRDVSVEDGRRAALTWRLGVRLFHVAPNAARAADPIRRSHCHWDIHPPSPTYPRRSLLNLTLICTHCGRTRLPIRVVPTQSYRHGYRKTRTLRGGRGPPLDCGGRRQAISRF